MDVNSFVIGFKKGKASGGGGGSMEGFRKVQFFNDDRTTLLYTVFVPDGSSAMYAGETPISTEDVGFIFAGFEPAPSNVTEDMECYAIYDPAATFADASWENISRISQTGAAENYYSVGDQKAIHVKGTIGLLSVDATYYAQIIGINHNRDLEGDGIHMLVFTLNTDKRIGLRNNQGSITGNSKAFNINHWGGRYGGWKGCDMRYDILGSTDVPPSDYGVSTPTNRVGYDPSPTCATNPVTNTVMGALPADLRAVMKPMTKYSDNKGISTRNNLGSYDPIASNVSVSLDYLPLMSPKEISGDPGYSNTYAAAKQQQYAFYANGASKALYAYNDENTSIRTWTRCWASKNGVVQWCDIGSYKGVGDTNDIGVAPIFKV